MFTIIAAVTCPLLISYHPGDHGNLILMKLLDVTGVGVDGVAVSTKLIVNGTQGLLDNLVPLPEVLD